MPPIRPSPIFLGLAGAMVAIGAYLTGQGRVSNLWVFAFVTLGWVVSLCLHEFAHAVVAYIGGDHSTSEKGYLQLDPTKYTHTALSFVWPIVFLMIGGIGLPGGAVWIKRGLINPIYMRSLMSLAGPMMNLAFGAACLLPIGFGWIDPSTNYTLAVSLGFLGYLQVSAMVLNLIPIPGFDGFGVLEPYLPASFKQAVAPIGSYAMMLVFFAFLYWDAFNRGFWDLVSDIASVFGGDPANLYALFREGFAEYRFWS